MKCNSAVGLLLLVSASCAVAHMPTYVGSANWEDPVNLGDITVNSWAVSTKLEPKEVMYYKFSGPKTKGPFNLEDTTNFFLGLYVPPGEQEKDFKFFVGIWGMSPATMKCRRWEGGWGRRSGGADHAHPPPTPEVHDHTSHLGKKDGHDHFVKQMVADGYTTIVGPEAIPERVKKSPKAPNDVMIFMADTTPKIGVKFEPFTPTVFQPRGSCISPFPREGEYYMAIWGEDTQTKAHHFSVGLGLKERDVMAFPNTILMDYIVIKMMMWNHWSVGAVIAPIIVLVLLAFAGMGLSAAKGMPPTPFQVLVITGGSGLLGFGIEIAVQLSWALSVADHGKNEAGLQIVLGIVVPMVFGLICIFFAFTESCCCRPGCMPIRYKLGQISASICTRIIVVLIGAFHLFGWHAGYIVFPVLLIVAGLLPPALADYGKDKDLPPYPPPPTDVEAAKVAGAPGEHVMGRDGPHEMFPAGGDGGALKHDDGKTFEMGAPVAVKNT